MVHITSTSTWCLKKILSRKAKLYIAEYFRNPFIRFCFWKVTHYLYKAFFPKHHKDIYGMEIPPPLGPPSQLFLKKKTLWEICIYHFYKKEITYACGSAPCLLTAEYDDLWHICILEYTVTVSKKEVDSHKLTWKDDQNIYLSEGNKLQYIFRACFYFFIFTYLFLVASGLTCSMRYLS